MEHNSEQLSHVSDNINTTYTNYWHNTNIPEYEIKLRLDYLEKLQDTLFDYDRKGEYFSTSMYEAALLQPIVDDAIEPNRFQDAAKKELANYINKSSQDVAEYAIGICLDKPIIDKFWNDKIEKHFDDNEPEKTLLQDKTNEMFVPPEIWRNTGTGIFADEILELRSDQHVNLESMLIDSIRRNIQLSSNKTCPDTQTLQNIIRAESFDSYLSEIIGFDGIAMSSRNNAGSLRMLYSGQVADFLRAHDLIRTTGTPEQFMRTSRDFLRGCFESAKINEVLGHKQNKDIIIFTGRVGDDEKIVGRRKTDYSAGKKFADKKYTYLTDIFGATVILDKPEQIGEEMNRVVNNIIQKDNMNFINSQKRNRPIFITGTKRFVKTILDSMPDVDLDLVQIRETGSDEYQTAKFAVEYQAPYNQNALNCEIQFNTVEIRTEARVGSLSHANYKASNGNIRKPTNTKLINAQVELHDEKDHLNRRNSSKKLTKRSRTRAREFIASISEY